MNVVLKYEKRFFFCYVVLFKFGLTSYEIYLYGLNQSTNFCHTLSILMIQRLYNHLIIHLIQFLSLILRETVLIETVRDVVV